MSVENSTTLQEKNESNEITTKLAATQKAIKNKFSRACAIRLENENNLNHAMQPHQMKTSIEATSQAFTKEHESTPTTKFVDGSVHKKDQETSIQYIENGNNTRKSFNNPNELCERLRILLSTMFEGDVNYVEEINAIIMKLREQEILL